MGMFTRFASSYKESQLYFRTREGFIWRAVWKLLSILAGFYSAISIIVAPFILSNWLSAREWLRMSLLFWSIILAFFVLLLLVLFLYSFSCKGRGKFDHLIKYEGSDIEKRLATIEAKLNNIESDTSAIKTNLSNIESRVVKIENWIHTQRPKKD